MPSHTKVFDSFIKPRKRYVREGSVENYLVEQVKKRGGRAIKFTSPGRIGVFDRLVLIPRHRTRMGIAAASIYVETKAPDGKLSTAQRTEYKWLLSSGFTPCVIYSKAEVDRFIRMYFSEE